MYISNVYAALSPLTWWRRDATASATTSAAAAVVQEDGGASCRTYGVAARGKHAAPYMQTV